MSDNYYATLSLPVDEDAPKLLHSLRQAAFRSQRRVIQTTVQVRASLVTTVIDGLANQSASPPIWAGTRGSGLSFSASYSSPGTIHDGGDESHLLEEFCNLLCEFNVLLRYREVAVLTLGEECQWLSVFRSNRDAQNGWKPHTRKFALDENAT